MKITAFLIVVFSVQASASSFGQNISLSYRNAPLKTVIKALSKQGNIDFVYKDQYLEKSRPVSVHIKNAPVETALKQIFYNQPFIYQVEDGIVYIMPKPIEEQILQLTPTPELRQDTVRGRVVNENGESVAGATVTVKGTRNATATDENGEFVLTGVDENATLVISGVNVETKEVSVDGRTRIDITLEPSLIGLQEVVAVGYTKQTRMHITSAVSSVSGKTIVNLPVNNNVNSLSGRMPGLKVIDPGGAPGNNNANFNIRGYGTPLVIVDGIQQNFNHINPDEIESISILKDASASIYGARAGNGVVLVTTKRGVISKPIFDFTLTHTSSTATTFPKLADAALFAQLVNQANVTAGISPMYTEEEIEKYKTGSDPAYPNTNWWDSTMKKWAPTTNYSFNVRGGSKDVRYFVSIGHKDQGSMLRSNDIQYSNYTFRSNIDANFTKRLSGRFDISGKFANQNFPGQNFAQIVTGLNNANPNVPAYWPDRDKAVAAGGTSGTNPIYLSQKEWSGYMQDKNENFRGSLGLDYDLSDFITKGLSASASFDYNHINIFDKNWITGFNYYTYDYSTEIYSPSSSFNNNKITLTESYNRSWNWRLEYRLDYKKTFASKHHLSGFVLYEALSNRLDLFNAYREGFISSGIDNLFAGSDQNKDNGGNAGEGGRQAYVGRFNYNFQQKYLAEFTMRYDASANFDKAHRWGFFPGVSVAWRMNEENFIKSTLPAIDNLKLRLSYGQAGDEGNVSFNYLTGYNFDGSYIFSSTDEIMKGVASKGLSNPLASWARTKIYNAGLDGSIWKNKLYWTIDVFYRLKDNILGTRSQSTPSTFGAALPQENINSLSDRGFELSIGHQNKIGKLNYEVSANVSWSRSRWEHFDELTYTDPDEIYRYRQTGRWRDITYGYLTDGLFSTQEEIDNWADITNGGHNNVIQPGDIRFLDLNKDGTINWKDERIIGRSNSPEMYTGLNVLVSYNNLALSSLFQGAFLYSVFYGGKLIAPFGNQLSEAYAFFEQAWTPENPNPDAPLPRLRNTSPAGHPNTSYTSDFYMVRDAYYVRIKELRLSYSFKRNLLKRFNVDGLSAFVMGYNLGFFTNVKYVDPENINARGEYYPQQKSIMFGLNLKF